MTVQFTNDAAALIHQTASVLHSLASTLTGDAKGALTVLQALLEKTDALPREQVDAVVAGLARIREHHRVGPTPDPVGDGNRLWQVFSAAWGLQVPVVGQGPRGELRVLESTGYAIEAIAQGIPSSAKEELGALISHLKPDAGYRFPGSDEIRAQMESALAGFMGNGSRRDALATLCRVNQALWASVLGR